MRCTKEVLAGLTEMCAIVETVLECGGEGWGLECVDGPDHDPCNKKTCEICRSFAAAEKACVWVRQEVDKRRARKT